MGTGRTWRNDVARADGNDDRSALLDPVARQAAGGDPDALEQLIWAIDELRLARATIRRLVVDESGAEEVEQDVLVAVAESIPSFRGDARFATWVHQIARHKAIGHLRRQRRTEPLPDEVGDAARISSVIATRTDIDRVIAALPDLYRPAVVLRDVERRPYEEVAQRLGLNLNTTKTRVARGRALAAASLRVDP